jgi:hypothetical protein
VLTSLLGRTPLCEEELEDDELEDDELEEDDVEVGEEELVGVLVTLLLEELAEEHPAKRAHKKTRLNFVTFIFKCYTMSTLHQEKYFIKRRKYSFFRF